MRNKTKQHRKTTKIRNSNKAKDNFYKTTKCDKKQEKKNNEHHSTTSKQGQNPKSNNKNLENISKHQKTLGKQ